MQCFVFSYTNWFIPTPTPRFLCSLCLLFGVCPMRRRRRPSAVWQLVGWPPTTPLLLLATILTLNKISGGSHQSLLILLLVVETNTLLDYLLVTSRSVSSNHSLSLFSNEWKHRASCLTKRWMSVPFEGYGGDIGSTFRKCFSSKVR
mmetsp:Transcript_17332/g.37424  ORF Transcript_17332/g.37424 Transcript_17332/m.37424 type:complete len:147 (-) Transcript_17332:113-553(-)